MDADTIFAISIPAGALALAIWLQWGESTGKRRFDAWCESRPCMGVRWRRRYPHAPKRDLREFLSMYVEVFDLPGKAKLAIGPDDDVWGTYARRNPWPLFKDGILENEFITELETRFRRKIDCGEGPITFGDLFAKATGAVPARGDRRPQP